MQRRTQSWLYALLVIGMLFSCDDGNTGTGPEEAPETDTDLFVMADYTAFAAGSWWRYEHMTADTVEYGLQLEEFVGTPVFFDSTVCHPYVHKTTAAAYPDTTFIKASDPLTLKGFAWRGLRFLYRPCYRQARDTMRLGDTLTFSYDVALVGDTAGATDTALVQLTVCGIDSSPVHTDFFRTCLKVRVEEGETVEERWMVESVGVVAAKRWVRDSLILTERLAASTLAGVSMVYH